MSREIEDAILDWSPDGFHPMNPKHKATMKNYTPDESTRKPELGPLGTAVGVAVLVPIISLALILGGAVLLLLWPILVIASTRSKK